MISDSLVGPLDRRKETNLKNGASLVHLRQDLLVWKSGHKECVLLITTDVVPRQRKIARCRTTQHVNIIFLPAVVRMEANVMFQTRRKVA